MKTKKTFVVTFHDHFEGETEEQCYDQLLEYLKNCVNDGDVCAFSFKELEPSQKTDKLSEMKAKVEADSPYNDGWTKEFYDKALKNIK